MQLGGLPQHLHAYGSHEAGRNEGAVGLVEGDRGKAVSLGAGPGVSDEAVHPHVHHFHFQGVLTGLLTLGKADAVGGFPQEVHMPAVQVNIGHLAHFSQVDGEAQGLGGFGQGEAVAVGGGAGEVLHGVF